MIEIMWRASRLRDVFCDPIFCCGGQVGGVPLARRAKGIDLPDGQISWCFPGWPVQPLLQKYFPSRLTQISSLIRIVLSHRGALRTSRTRGGMRWTRAAHVTNGADADGEVVWF
jgi:hypothetical protein